jgi:hypothetical protein
MMQLTPTIIKENKVFLIQLMITTLLFSIPSLYNRFPLVFSDSGTYLVTLFDSCVPLDRPFGYGFLMRIMTGKLSIWPVIVFQNLIATILIWKVLSRFFNGKMLVLIHMLTCLILLVSSSLVWYSNQIMPDVITPYMILVLYLFFTSKSRFKGLYLITLVLFLITHFSHFPIFIFSVITITGLHLFFKIESVKHLLLKVVALAFVFIVGVFTLFYQSYINDKGFVFSHSSNVFLTGRICETGLLKKYLEEKCSENTNLLCPYKDQLSNSSSDLIWNEGSAINTIAQNYCVEQSIINPTFEQKWNYLNNDLLKPIVKDVLTTPKYMIQFIYFGIRDSFIQFFQVNLGSGLSAYGKDSPPYWPIRDHLAVELPLYLTAVQSTTKFNFDALNIVNYIALLISMCSIWYIWFIGKMHTHVKILVVFLILCIYWNALFTAAFGNIYDRLQARVSWLLILTAIVAVASTYSDKLARLFEDNEEVK